MPAPGRQRAGRAAGLNRGAFIELRAPKRNVIQKMRGDGCVTTEAAYAFGPRRSNCPRMSVRLINSLRNRKGPLEKPKHVPGSPRIAASRKRVTVSDSQRKANKGSDSCPTKAAKKKKKKKKPRIEPRVSVGKIWRRAASCETDRRITQDERRATARRFAWRCITALRSNKRSEKHHAADPRNARHKADRGTVSAHPTEEQDGRQLPPRRLTIKNACRQQQNQSGGGLVDPLIKNDEPEDPMRGDRGPPSSGAGSTQ